MKVFETKTVVFILNYFLHDLDGQFSGMSRSVLLYELNLKVQQIQVQHISSYCIF